MNVTVKLLGICASFIWLSLAVLTTASGLLMSNALTVHFVVACLFAGIAALVWWRVRAVDALHTAVFNEPTLRNLLRVEVATCAALLVAGVLLLAAAMSRVFGEGTAVFG